MLVYLVFSIQIVYKIMSNKQIKNYDPGWNDPPMLNYNATNPPPKSRIGNKRISFPLFSANSQQTNRESMVAGMPPINTSPNVGNVLAVNLSPESSSDGKLKEVKENIDKILSTKTGNQTILNKYELMTSMWSTSKLQADCQNDLLEIVKLITKHEFDKAEQLKCNMYKKYETQCESWIELINYLTEVCKQ